MGFPRNSRHFVLSESMEKMTLCECKGSSCSSKVSKWSLGKRGRTQTRVFPSTFPSAVAGCLKLLDRITRGNIHKPALLLLVLCQSWQTMVWSIHRRNSSKRLTKAVWSWPTDPGTQGSTQISLMVSCSAYTTCMPRGRVSFGHPCAVIAQVSQFPSCAGLAAPELHCKLQRWQRWQTAPKSENQFC